MVVYVVDDDREFRRFVAKVALSGGLEPREFDSGMTFLREYQGDGGCLVLDFQMPGINGLDVLTALREAGHRLPVIFATANADVPLAVKVMKLGVVEFLTKPCPPSELLVAIQKASAEAARLTVQSARTAESQALLASLSEREREVAYLLANGHDTKGVADRLSLSDKTIEYHRTRIFRKLNVSNVVEMTHLILKGCRANRE